MAARYENVWLKLSQQQYTDPDRFTVDTPPDPEHGNKSDAPPPLMMDAPVLQSGGEITTDTVWEELEPLPPGDPIDTTPVEGQGNPEDSGHGFGGLTRPGATEGELAVARGIDRGAHRRATRTTPTYRFFNESFFGYFTKGFQPPPITAGGNNPVFIRGINGHPINNGSQDRPTAWKVDTGDGIVNGARPGDYESSNVDRDFSPPDRRHNQIKTVDPDIVTIIGDVPPPDKSDTYSPVFSSLQKFLPKRRRVHGMRRDPGPFDEDLVALPAPGNITTHSADGMVAL